MSGNKKKHSAKKSEPAAPVSTEPMSAKAYDKELKRLHVELVKLQQWVVAKGLKVCIVFEGRDGAGKGGTIKAITERVSPRVFRVVALPAPTEREKTQMYIQRYIPHFPAAGEIVIFDRSWYNRAGVERVMGFAKPEQVKKFLDVVPMVEKAMVESGIILLKYWLEVSPEEQERRLSDRIDDGRKVWKLSPMDVKSFDKWDDYTVARDEMFEKTDSSWAPWFVARSEDKKKVRLNVISHLLAHVPYEEIPAEKVKLPKRKIGRVKATDYPFKYVPEKY
ncbi:MULTISPECIES: polyphosphate kinase 2 [Niveibacterium]|uniref:ADP/GDP-polyphosphate phosphotransferase n=1 Tax=Niveibacterium microcysteis TaxID=2811415 RepID=A0ABX7MB25_9RHOO|nr:MULTISPECIES: polyphosphate kinase 2 [Niveibacterium]QSI78076.1 polyphosphate kinase 2 [Niveibacterium microcysteis]